MSRAALHRGLRVHDCLVASQHHVRELLEVNAPIACRRNNTTSFDARTANLECNLSREAKCVNVQRASRTGH